jgi:signal transduction histidine kinase
VLTAISHSLYFNVILFVAGATGATVALLWTIRHRDKKATTEFGLFLVTLVLWNAFQIAELLGGRTTAYYASFGIRVIRGFMAVSWMYFTVTFAGYRHVLDRWPARLITATGLVYLLVFTGLPSVATSVTFDVAEFSEPSVVTYTTLGLTPYMAIARLFGYGFVGTGIATLPYRLFYSGYARRWQTMVFLVVTTGNVLLDLFYAFGVLPGLRGVDYTAVGTVCVAVAFVLTIYRTDLFEFIPVVRSHVVENIDDAVVVLNPNRRVVDYNSTAESVFRRPVTLGDEAADVLPAAVVDTELVGTFSAGRTTITVPTDGETTYYDVSASKVTAVGGIAGLVLILRDVTERERQRRQLRANRRELARKNERLEEFAKIVSHDLRNPLAVARGNLELVADESEPAEAIADALERMDEIIEDTLTMAREGQSVVETEQVPVHELATECWADVATQGATLTVDGEMYLEADRNRLKHVFENLFRNSVEHGSTNSRSQTDGGVAQADSGPTIEVGFTDDGFYVADDGPGIPEGQRDDIFDSGYTTAADGTGFGLAIVAEIVEAHGWTVSVTESERGGAKFEISGVDSCEHPGE